MKKSVGTLSLIMAVLMLLGAFAGLTACSKPQGEGDSTSTAAVDVTDTIPAETTSKYEIGDEIPTTLNFNGETVTIVSRSNKWVVDEVTIDNSDGGLIDSAVERRNKVVEQRLGITIENTKIDGNNYVVADIIRNQAATGHLYDIFANSVYSTIKYTAENCFANLKSVDNLDLARPYWSQGFNEAASIGDKQ